MVNRVILAGNLTRDPETSSGPATTMTRMRLATNVTWNSGDGVRQQSTEFHSIVTFGALADTCSQYLRRGRRIYVEGKLRTREYVAADSTTRRTTEIVADSVQFLDRAPATATTSGVELGSDGAEAEADLDPVAVGA
ncbi:MAG: single-stranded DNA-binding protein [Candidatus Dormibacteria bacterium]